MRILGLDVREANQSFGLSLPVHPFPVKQAPAGAQGVYENRGIWWPTVREPYTGAWQRNHEWTTDTVMAFGAVYSCITLIANDVAKLRIKLMEQDANNIWKEVRSAAFSPVLRKPNRFQNRIQFLAWWVTSKLTRGNAYIYLERDERKVVRAMYVLDPSRVRVLVAPDGSVYYELDADNLTGLESKTVVPASELIHDRMNCLFHPLIGTSPIFANGAAANIGIKIEQNSTNFFANGSRVAGQLLIPTAIPQDKADEYRERWNANFTGPNAKQLAVLSGGMKFEPIQMTAVDAQLIEQLRWTSEQVCSTFHVDAYKIHIGKAPAYTSPDLANQMYYSDCLQSHIEQIELCLDEGLGIGEGSPKEGKTYGVELDLDGLIRMDTAAQMTTLVTATGGAVLTPDEGRARVNLGPLPGGDTLYRQQQNYALEALAKRDAKADPFATTQPAATPVPDDEEEEDDEEKAFDFAAAFQTFEKEYATA